MRARQVLIAEHLGRAAMQEGGAIDAAIRAVARGNGLLRDAVLAVNIPRELPNSSRSSVIRCEEYNRSTLFRQRRKLTVAAFSLVFCKIMG